MPDPSGINPLVGRVAPAPAGPTFDDALGTQARYEQVQAFRQQRVQAAMDAASTQAALQHAQGDVPTAIDTLLKSGRAGAAEGLQKAWDEHQTKAQTIAKQHLEMMAAQSGMAADWAHGLIGHPERFAAAKQALVPEVGALLGDQYDETRLQTIADTSSKAEQWHKDAAAAVAHAPKDLESAIRLTASLAKDAPDQASWDSLSGYYDAIGQKVLAGQIRQQLGPYSPEGKARAAQLALTAEQQQLAPGQAAQAAKAQADALKAAAEAKAEPTKAAADLMRAQTAQQLAGIGIAGAAQAPITPDRPDDPTTANQPIPGIGLTPSAIYQGALSVALTGKQGAVTSRAAAMQPAIKAMSNKAAAIAEAAGVNLPQLQSEWNASSSTVKNLTQRYQLLASSATTANENIAYARDLSKKVDRTSIPAVNRFSQWLQSELGGSKLPDLSAFELAIYTASREYAKVVSGSAASISELSQTAAQKADQLLNAAQQPQQFEKVTQVMQGDMGRVTDPLLKTIKSTPGLGDNTRKFLDFIGRVSSTSTASTAKDPLGIR